MRIMDVYLDKDVPEDEVYYVVTDFTKKRAKGLIFRDGYFSCLFDLSRNLVEKEYQGNLFDSTSKLRLYYF